MNGALLSRYLYKNRVYYIICVYIYIAAYTCGAFYGARVEVCLPDEVKLMSVLLDSVIPMAVISVGGLFFAGSLLACGGLCVIAYRMGVLLGASVAVSFGNVIAYLFFVGIPVGAVYFLCGVCALSSALECNVSRLEIRRKGLARPMNNAEIRGYFGRCLVLLGVCVIMTVLEYWVFLRAFVNIIN